MTLITKPLANPWLRPSPVNPATIPHLTPVFPLFLPLQKNIRFTTDLTKLGALKNEETKPTFPAPFRPVSYDCPITCEDRPSADNKSNIHGISGRQILYLSHHEWWATRERGRASVRSPLQFRTKRRPGGRDVRPGLEGIMRGKDPDKCPGHATNILEWDRGARGVRRAQGRRHCPPLHRERGRG